jgi:putative Holliday junction resolvase
VTDTPLKGRRLGVDIGKARVGVAWSDPDGILAAPLETVPRDNSDTTVPSDIGRLAELVDEHLIVEVVVGLPVRLSGEESFAAAEARAYADRLARAIAPIPVRLIDERLTTRVASRRLSERGVKGRRQRAVVDQAAAVEILQLWLEKQRKA